MRRSLATMVAIAFAIAGCTSVAPPSAASPATASPASSSPVPAVPVESSPSIKARTPIPAELAYVWVGPARDIAALGGPQAVSIIRIRGAQLDYILGGHDEEALKSAVSVSGPGQVRFTSVNTTGGCQIGDEGTYGWATVTDGAGLTLTKVAETCSPRAEAVVGDWVRAACKDFGCLGDLGAGEHRTAFFEPLGDPTALNGSWRMQYGSMSYTVPSGWANAVDDPNFYDIVPTGEYAKTVPDMSRYSGIALIPDVGVVAPEDGCSPSVESGFSRSMDDMTARIAEIPSLDVGVATSINLAGRSGRMFDVALKEGSSQSCAADGGVPVLRSLGWDRRMTAGERWRLILLDVADGRTMAIVINDASVPSRFDDLVAQAILIVKSFELHLPS
jgi:hypothetical protein